MVASGIPRPAILVEVMEQPPIAAWTPQLMQAICRPLGLVTSWDPRGDDFNGIFDGLADATC